MNWEEYIPPNLQKWLFAFSISSWTKPLTSFLLGQGLGVYAAYSNGGHFSFGAFLTGLLFTIGGSIFVTLLNDWYDAPVDLIKRQMFPESTGPKTIPDKILPREQVFNVALISGLATLAISVLGGIVNGLGDFPAYAMICGAVFVAYTLPPLKLNYRGGGELLQAIGLGLALPWVNSYLQARTFHIAGLLQILIPYMLLILAYGIANGLKDEESDRRGGKMTLVTIFGNEKSRRIVEGLVAITLVVGLLLGLLILKISPIVSLPPLIPILWSLWGIRKHSNQATTSNFGPINRYLWSLKTGVLIYGIWFALSALLFKIFLH